MTSSTCLRNRRASEWMTSVVRSKPSATLNLRSAESPIANHLFNKIVYPLSRHRIIVLLKITGEHQPSFTNGYILLSIIRRRISLTIAPISCRRNALLEMIADLQSERMDEQRAQLPGLVTSHNRNGAPLNNQPPAQFPRGRMASEPAPDDAFLDMLMRCQGSRLEEQRSELPRPNVTSDAEQVEPPNVNRRAGSAASNAGATVPDEDFFSLIIINACAWRPNGGPTSSSK